MFFYSSSTPTNTPQQQNTEKYEPKNNSSEANKSLWQKARTDPIAFFTLWLVIFTAVLSGVGVIQLKLLGRAETVAEKSANAAKESANVAREALVSAQRAFLSVQAFFNQKFLDQTTKQIVGRRIIPKWENSGTTPTKNAFTYGNWVLFDEKGMPDDFDFADRPGVGPVRTLFAPKAVIDGGALDIPLEVFEKVRNGKGHLYIYGWADYNDIFENTPRHRTEFCTEILVSGDPINDASITFSVHKKYNGADGEATRQPKSYP